MKMVIFGSRAFSNYKLMKAVIQETPLYKTGKITHIISGGAGGADSLAIKWAREENIPLTIMMAQWDKYGRAAGYRRNEEMAAEAECAIAFWDGYSRGTLHMINICKKRNIPLMVYKTDTGEFSIDIPK